MKNLAGVLLATVLVVVLATGPEAKESKKEQSRFYRPNYVETDIDIPDYEPVSKLLPAAAAADTYCVVWYDFEVADWQGWTGIDNTAQEGTFFHVDDFAGLGGGSSGRLVPIDGDKSMWCGVRPGGEFDDYICSWETAPGYGDNWNQEMMGLVFLRTGKFSISFSLVNDTEPDYDNLYLEYIPFDGGWESLDRFTGVVDTLYEKTVYTALAATKIRFKFVSDGLYSDHDGVYDSDGACILDNITITDELGVWHSEDFESYDVGETYTTVWHAYSDAGYGTYSGLASGLVDKDPCNRNFGTLLVFFEGSSYPSIDYPGLYDTPFYNSNYKQQNEMAVFPPIDLTRYSAGRDETQDTAIQAGDLPGLKTTLLRFNTYADLPYNNQVTRTWYMRNIEGGCPGRWINTYDAYWHFYSESKAWEFEEMDISSLITSDTIQVALGVADMYSLWYQPVGQGEEHTPAPWFDNVRICRTAGRHGPSWSVRRIDMFQDTFPQEVAGSIDPMEDFCRADMANDVGPYDDYDRIDPGDSAVVRVAAPFAGGLDTLATGEARVYCHVNVTFLGRDGKPDLFGPQLAGTYGSYVSDDGDWTILLCEPARSASGLISPDAYCVDMNDSLFTRGYMIEYYFKAWALDGTSSTWPWGAEWMDPSPFRGSSRLPEFTCLPTLQVVPGMLYIDDFDGRGTFDGTVQAYFDYTFKIYTPSGEPRPDRYDVCGPSSGVSNGIGAYTSVTDASSIFCTAYEVVILDSGDLGWCTISEGTEHSDKSNDAQLLVDWMNVSEHKVGLLVMGDQIALDLDDSHAAVALELVSTICGATLENSSYCEMTGGWDGGGIVSPIVTGVPGGPFDNLSYYAFGGCPWVNNFDVLERTGPGDYALQYPDYGDQQYYAGIYTDQLNNASRSLRTVWVGHSFMYIRDTHLGWLARYQFIDNLRSFFEMGVWTSYSDSELPKATSLSQNFPNPFNPVTRVSFSLKEKGHVSMRVYDVSGRLVRVLVDEEREAGAYEVMWDGMNNGGRSTASGIYFCRMEADDYQRTVKMVLLR